MPIDKSFQGSYRDSRQRITELERRLGRLPDRLSTSGQRVADWNRAVSAGFYWGNGAAGQPSSPTDYPGTNHTWWVGQVLAFPSGATNVVKQLLSRPNYLGGWEFTRYSTDGGASWTAWENIGFTEPWTSLVDYLATGISYVADGAPDLAGIRARRVGPNTELSLGNFRIDSISVPLNGNTANRDILTGIPSKFRPAGGASITSGWNGRVWNGYVRSNGAVVVGSIMPSVNWSVESVITNEVFSGTAFYPSVS